jgi:hypothetical protein
VSHLPFVSVAAAYIPQTICEINCKRPSPCKLSKRATYQVKSDTVDIYAESVS